MNRPKSHHDIRGKRGKFKGKFQKKGSVSRREKLSASIASIAQRKKSSDTTEDFDGSRIKTNILHGRLRKGEAGIRTLFTEKNSCGKPRVTNRKAIISKLSKYMSQIIS